MPRQKDGIKLCCNKAKCPVVKLVNNDQITITDDDGNTVLIDIDQGNILPKAIKSLQANREL